MSNGVPPRAAAASASSAKPNSAAGSTKRRISQAHAVRSMCGCGRVIQSMVVSCGPSAGARYVEGTEGVRDGGRRAHPSGGAEVIPPPLEAEGALESPELAERGWSLALRGAGPSPPGRTREVPGRLGQRSIAAVRLRAEAAHQLAVLRLIETGRLPHERGAAL